MITYTVAVETGSCSMDQDRDEDGRNIGPRWEERANCGHAHRTLEAAEKCRKRLTRRDKRGNSSALWYNARIHDGEGHRC